MCPIASFQRWATLISINSVSVNKSINPNLVYAQLGGKVEAYTKFGLIDLLTETELIEIKVAHRWKDAIGHIVAKSEKYPNHKKRLHLFGIQEPILDNIQDICDRLGIQVTFELVEKEIRQLTAMQ